MVIVVHRKIVPVMIIHNGLDLTVPNQFVIKRVYTVVIVQLQILVLVTRHNGMELCAKYQFVMYPVV